MLVKIVINKIKHDPIQMDLHDLSGFNADVLRVESSTVNMYY